MRYKLKVTVVALCLGVEYTFTKTIVRKNPKDVDEPKNAFVEGIKHRGYEIKTVSTIGTWVR